jgi:16S rRNA U516 pseudouridylate synthase RsuA-like enzyme
MKLELSEGLEEQLRERAKHLGVGVEDLARAAVADLVGQPAADFEKAAQDVLARNAELYRRLA